MSMDEIHKEEEFSKFEENKEEAIPVEGEVESIGEKADEKESSVGSNAAEPDLETKEEEPAQPISEGDIKKAESNIIFFGRPVEGKFQKIVVGVLSVILSPIISALILGIVTAVVALVGVVVLLVVALAFGIVLVILIALFFALPILIPIAILISLITGKGKVSIGRHGISLSK